MEYTDRGKWEALAVLGVAYLMVVLDISSVNVALPSIETDLEFTPDNLQWVVSAYSLTFGGFLLLGGRAGDLLGRRRVFMAGLGLFALSSLVCGLSQSDTMLILARGVQGAAAAILSPSVFSIVMVTFKEGAERNKALGILGGIAGAGGAIGVLAGGVLTEYAGWQWIFFVNVPIGLAALALVPRLVKESRLEGAQRHFDALGAVVITSALLMLVYAITQANDAGWGSLQTVGLMTLSIILIGAFAVIENRSPAPLVPLGFFRKRTPTGANIVGFGLGSAISGMFLLQSL
jgi:MFS family permease